LLDVTKDTPPVDDAARHGLGGNNPPDPIEILRGELRTTYADFVRRGAELIGALDRLPLFADMNDDWEAKITETVKSCSSFMKNSEAARLAANEPYRKLIATTDGFFKSLSDKVDAAKKKMTSELLTPYQQQKADAERRRREEEAREARERAEEAARVAREEAARVAELKRQEEAAKAEAERLKRERAEAEERRKREQIEAEERAERDRQAAIQAEAEAKNKRARAAAAAAKEKIEREERERQEKAAALVREQRAKDKAARDEAARVEAEAKAKRKEAERGAAIARDEAASATQADNRASRAAKVNTAVISRTRTDLGAVASLRTVWRHEVVDPASVPRLYLQVDEGAIASAVIAATKDGKCDLIIAGVRIFPVTDSVVR